MKEEFTLEKKMKSPTFIFFINVAVIIAIFFNAELGRLLGLKNLPLNISLVWPSTGFALASLLIFGFQVWPGVFLGNFIYNFSNLYTNVDLQNTTFILTLFSASIISLGSLFQALLGNIIMRTFTTRTYFNTVKDIVVFLLFAGLLSCMIASTIGIAIFFYLYQSITFETTFLTWVTFWLGDSMGVFIFTPFLVVWTLQKYKTINSLVEAFFIVVSVLSVAYLYYHFNYPVMYLLIPISMWTAYRFGMHGATLGIIFITLVIILPISLNNQLFNESSQSFLLNTVILLEVVVAASLLVAAIVNEKNLAWIQMEKHYVDFQTAIDISTDQKVNKPSSLIIKRRISELGLITSGINLQIHNLLNKIDFHVTEGTNCNKEIYNYLTSISKLVELESIQKIQKSFDILSHCFNSLKEIENDAKTILDIVEGQSILTSSGVSRLKKLNVNTILHLSLNKAISLVKEVNFTTNENYDDNIELIEAIPEDLSFAFFYLITVSIQSLQAKHHAKQSEITCSISTKMHENHIEITIKDNGIGFHSHDLKNFFNEIKKELKNIKLESIYNKYYLPLIIAHDIIVNIYKGTITIDTNENEFLIFIIKLPVE